MVASGITATEETKEVAEHVERLEDSLSGKDALSIDVSLHSDVVVWPFVVLVELVVPLVALGGEVGQWPLHVPLSVLQARLVHRDLVQELVTDDSVFLDLGRSSASCVFFVSSGAFPDAHAWLRFLALCGKQVRLDADPVPTTHRRASS